MARAAWLAMLIALVTAILLMPVYADGGPFDDLETSVIWGKVADNANGSGCPGFNVTFETESYIGKTATTDENGWYKVNISAGSYLVHVRDGSGRELGRKNVEVSDGQIKRLDFVVDPVHPPRSHLYGLVIDGSGDPVEDALVELSVGSSAYNSTMTTETGFYDLTGPPGIYNLTVSYKGEIVLERTVELESFQEKEINLTVDIEDSGTLTPRDILGFAEENWASILLMLGLLLGLSAIMLTVQRFLGRLRKTKDKRIPEWLKPVSLFARRSFAIAFISVTVWQLSEISSWIRERVWEWFVGAIIPAFGIVLVLMLASIGFQVSDNLWNGLRRRWGKGGENGISKQIVAILTLVTRYSIAFLSIALVGLLILSAFGLSSGIFRTIGGFLSGNATRLIFLAVLVAIAILSKKFVDIFFKEVGTRSSKLSPEMIAISHKGSMAGIYFILGLIFIFTLLSIAGLGEIGTTLVIVVSMIVGLVVSFAATGSIGNMLSGLVLVTMKPYEVGDRIGIGNGTVADVASIGLMFTKVRDLDSRMRDIPNNAMMTDHIVNFSRSASEGGFAIVIDVTLGYDLNPKRVRALMKRAAAATKGILESPQPNVIVTSFQNHAVEYRLRAYTKDARNMLFIRSTVMENMMDIFHSEGMEILSPLFEIERKAAFPTPEELLDRTRSVKQSEASTTGLTMFEGTERPVVESERA